MFSGSLFLLNLGFWARDSAMKDMQVHNFHCGRALRCGLHYFKQRTMMADLCYSRGWTRWRWLSWRGYDKFRILRFWTMGGQQVGFWFVLGICFKWQTWLLCAWIWWLLDAKKMQWRIHDLAYLCWVHEAEIVCGCDFRFVLVMEGERRDGLRRKV